MGSGTTLPFAEEVIDDEADFVELLEKNDMVVVVQEW